MMRRYALDRELLWDVFLLVVILAIFAGLLY